MAYIAVLMFFVVQSCTAGDKISYTTEITFVTADILPKDVIATMEQCKTVNGKEEKCEQWSITKPKNSVKSDE